MAVRYFKDDLVQKHLMGEDVGIPDVDLPSDDEGGDEEYMPVEEITGKFGPNEEVVAEDEDSIPEIELLPKRGKGSRGGKVGGRGGRGRGGGVKKSQPKPKPKPKKDKEPTPEQLERLAVVQKKYAMIDLIEPYEFMYNKRLKDHHNAAKMHNRWVQIAKAIGEDSRKYSEQFFTYIICIVKYINLNSIHKNYKLNLNSINK